MDKKVQEFLDYAREDGISLQELLTGIVNIDDSYAFMTIKKEIELGKQNGADADFVYDKLLSIVSGEQMYTYIRIQEIVNEITSDEGLEICLDFDLDELEILKANRDAIKQELKNRGVEYVGYVENNVSGVVTVQAATSAMEISLEDVVKLNDGTVWIIETKGGQKGKQDQNIDIKVLSKFYAFKDYAEKNKINWGFVRPMNGELYLNNTEYTKNIEDSRWVNLNNFF